MSLATATAANAAWKPPYNEPVFVITGGSSGIGQAMVEAFAKLTNGRAHIYILARNQAAAERILTSLPDGQGPDSQDIQWKRQFIRCDVTLMKNVKKACLQLVEELPKINFFVICSGYLSLGGRVDTEEGIDEQMAVRHYSRWRFIHDLMPLFRKARDAGEDARVMSVLAAGENLPVPINLDDLGLKKNYSGVKAGSLTAAYNDYSLEEFSIREPGMAFIHIYPGFVRTPGWDILLAHWMLWPIRPIVKILVGWLGTTQEDCAQYMWYALLRNKVGFFRCGSKGDSVGSKNYDGSETIRKAVWDHTSEITNC